MERIIIFIILCFLIQEHKNMSLHLFESISKLKKYFFNVYFWEREKEAERKRHKIWSTLQALSCQHRAWRRARTHEPWHHELSRSRTLNRLSTQVPHMRTFFNVFVAFTWINFLMFLLSLLSAIKGRLERKIIHPFLIIFPDQLL